MAMSQDTVVIEQPLTAATTEQQVNVTDNFWNHAVIFESCTARRFIFRLNIETRRSLVK